MHYKRPKSIPYSGRKQLPVKKKIIKNKKKKINKKAIQLTGFYTTRATIEVFSNGL